MTAPVDVIVVGAGFAGVLIAHNLARQGISVLVLDLAPAYPNVLRAEKIEIDQAAVLRRLGALDCRLPFAQPVGQTVNFSGERHEPHDTREQYGIDYRETVNNMRERLLTGIDLRVEEVQVIRNGEHTQTVLTRSGQTLECRLVILASGGNEKLLAASGLHRQIDTSLRSLTFGFDVVARDGGAPRVAGFNYFPDATHDRVDYLTLFPVGSRVRANLFTQWKPRSPEFKRMSASPEAVLTRNFPRLEENIGPFRIGGKLQFFSTQFYRLASPQVAGVVVVGDEYQSVCPATGTGLSKVLNDSALLVEHWVPAWLSTPGMGASKIRQFYADPAKRAVDDDALDRWRYYRDRLATPLQVRACQIRDAARRLLRR
jgi:2-polyprenyl-6-methoxyphenol hydroxylase-like FAD-dependent oxidoreductase